MIDIGKIKLTILRLPDATVNAAYSDYCANPVPSFLKSQKAEFLSQQIGKGALTLDRVYACQHKATQAAPQPTPQPAQADTAATQRTASEIANLHSRVDNLPTFDSVRKTADQAAANAAQPVADHLRATAAVADRAETLSLILKKSVDTVAAAVQDLSAQVSSKQSDIDPAAVSREVAAAVAKAFRPFEQSVIDAGAQTQVGALVQATVIDRRPCFDVFGITVINQSGKDSMVDIWDHPQAPAIDPCYIWTEENVRVMLYGQETGRNAWLGGDKGAGKTMLAQQFAAATGRQCVRINFHKHSDQEEYIGAVGLSNGATQFTPGPFLRGYTCPGTVIILDELTQGSAGCLAPLNALLESNAAVSIGDKVWRKAPGVICIACDNTLSTGDSSGRYAGTKEMNVSLSDRFDLIVPMTYLPLQTEIDAVVKHTGCNPLLASRVMAVITMARAKVATGDIIDAPSIRSVIAFIKAMKHFPVLKAWELTITARQPAESGPALDALRIASLNVNEIEKLL